MNTDCGAAVRERAAAFAAASIFKSTETTEFIP